MKTTHSNTENHPAARTVIWEPDHHPLADVIEAATAVLADRNTASEDAHQASYLISTLRRVQ